MRILLLGGYGGFGARIAQRLAAAGHEVLVAGRSHEKAAHFCAGRPGLPLALDRNTGLAAVLAEERPALLIDAAGPFQGAGYGVARACIAAGCHYLDIADGRDFAAGIGELDEAAQAAGVAVISGASSVPALSGAVVRELAAGMESVSAIEMAISASNRATAGPSVTKAIFSYIGKAIPLWRGRRKAMGHGWQDLQRLDFTIAGQPPLRGRLVGLADVPDLALLPGRLPGRPAVTFRAGTEMATQNLALWLASCPVRWGWLADLARFVPLVLRAQKLTSGFGSDRSGMMVRLFGLAEGARVERRWTLIAGQGDGPEIPGLAAAILVDRLAAGTIAPGARDAGELLTLAEFEPAFSSRQRPGRVHARTAPAAAAARASHGGSTSELSQDGEYLVERFGPLRFGFHLAADGEGLTMHLKRWWLGPIALPLALAPRSLAREWEADGRFQFDVPIALPLIGTVVYYRGWLQRK